MPGRAIGAITDVEQKTIHVLTDDMLVKQLQRDAHRIGASFDRLCLDEIRTMSRLFSRLSLGLYAGIRKATNDEDELRTSCFHLLSNALHSFIAAATILRNGFRLQPGVLVRNILETLTAVICIFSSETDWRDFKADRLKPEQKIGAANKVIPIFGRAYGYFSERFAHIRAGYGEPNWLVSYESVDEPLRANLYFLKLSLWLIYVVVELVFFEMSKPMCWERLDPGVYCYRPTQEGTEWETTLLGGTDVVGKEKASS